MLAEPEWETAEVVQEHFPHSAEMERALIGSVLESIAVFRIVSENVCADDFFIHRNHWIWDALFRLAEKDVQPTITLLMNELNDFRPGDVDYSYLSQCQNDAQGCVSLDTLREYSRKIREYSVRRKLLDSANRIANAAYDHKKPVETCLAESLTFIQEIASKSVTGASVSMRQAASQLYDHTEKIMKLKEPPGWMTGLGDFDRLHGGLIPGRSGIIGARPGKGKTSLMLTMIAGLFWDFYKNCPRGRRPKVILNSMEMTVLAISQRIAAMIARIDSEKIQRGILDDDELMRFNDAIAEIGTWPLEIIDERDPAILFGKISQKVAVGQCDLLFNDYVGKFETKAENRVREISFASQYMQKIATQLDIPVTTNAQVNRDTETKGKDYRLVLRDLKESGSLEEDADWVLFMNVDTQNPNVRNCELAKNRHGRTGSFDLLFQSAYTRYVNATTRTIGENA